MANSLPNLTKQKAPKRGKSPAKGADLSQITQGAALSRPDPLALKEQKFYERTDKKLRLQNLNLEHTIGMRQKFAKSIEKLVKVYLGFIALVILGSSVTVPSDSWICKNIGCISVQISDQVVITLLGTTTFMVLGLLHIVAKYIFSTHHDKS